MELSNLIRRRPFRQRISIEEERRRIDLSHNKILNGKGGKVRAAIIYHMWPHYRAAVMAELDRSEVVDYTFVGDFSSLEGIEPIGLEQVRKSLSIGYRKLGKYFWQGKAICLAMTGEWDVVIYLGNPNFLSTWIAAFVSRLRGVSVIFWEHGWRKRESRARTALRVAFFSIADKVMVYAPRARQLGMHAGFPEHKIVVVWNSLDTRRSELNYAAIVAGKLTGIQPAKFFVDRNAPILICTARITWACRFDILIEAAAILRKRGLNCNILLVGDGPVVNELKLQAATLGQPIHFFGACYDEEILGQLIYHSDVTVSPGKVGLTAMHSMMYGTPVITHDNDDEQMPEVAAVHEGKTGARFLQNNASDLARVIHAWLANETARDVVRAACRAEIAAHWNPQNQARIINATVEALATRSVC